MSHCALIWIFLQNIQNYTKKDLHDQDNHDGVITHLEPDILECKVKWALESITTNKASGGDGIPVELFQTHNGILVSKSKKSLSHAWLFATPGTVAYQAPQPMEFSRQEH